MAHASMTKRDDRLIAALASGRTYQQSADEAGVSLRTVNRRMSDPEFRELVRAARSQLLDAATGRLAHAATAAVDALSDLAENAESEVARVSAAKALVNLIIPLGERIDFEERLCKLEEQHAHQSN